MKFIRMLKYLMKSLQSNKLYVDITYYICFHVFGKKTYKNSISSRKFIYNISSFLK